MIQIVLSVVEELGAGAVRGLLHGRFSATTREVHRVTTVPVVKMQQFDVAFRLLN